MQSNDVYDLLAPINCKLRSIIHRLACSVIVCSYTSIWAVVRCSANELEGVRSARPAHVALGTIRAKVHATSSFSGPSSRGKASNIGTSKRCCTAVIRISYQQWDVIASTTTNWTGTQSSILLEARRVCSIQVRTRVSLASEFVVKSIIEIGCGNGSHKQSCNESLHRCFCEVLSVFGQNLRQKSHTLSEAKIWYISVEGL